MVTIIKIHSLRLSHFDISCMIITSKLINFTIEDLFLFLFDSHLSNYGQIVLRKFTETLASRAPFQILNLYRQTCSQ
jgi:hypothetical protein